MCVCFALKGKEIAGAAVKQPAMEVKIAVAALAVLATPTATARALANAAIAVVKAAGPTTMDRPHPAVASAHLSKVLAVQ